jgi:hypothetical protein
VSLDNVFVIIEALRRGFLGRGRGNQLWQLHDIEDRLRGPTENELSDFRQL